MNKEKDSTQIEYADVVPSEKAGTDKIVDKKIEMIKDLVKRLYPIIKSKKIETKSGIYDKNSFPTNTINNPKLLNQSLDPKIEMSLRKKSDLANVPFEILEQVYCRGIESWNNEKISAEQHAFNRVNSYIGGGKAYELDEDLRKWHQEKWVRFDTKGNIKGPCAREGGEGKPKCLPLAKARAMSKEARAKAARKKRRHDPVADRKGKGEKPVFVATEEIIIEKNVPTNPKLWARAKSLARQKFDVYPSAYANSFAAKWYKKKGGSWKSLTEKKHHSKKKIPVEKLESPIILRPELSYETKNREIYSVFRKSMDPMSEGKILKNILDTLKKINKNTKFPNDRYQEALKRIEDPSKPMNAARGKASRNAYKVTARAMEKSGRYPTREETQLNESTPAWQRKEGKNPEGGLNAKGVASYRRENPGSKLQTAVTTHPSKLKKGSKSWKRRRAFCKRMKGMKKRLTSAKTARDPDSRINKSLRKWNCN